MIVFFLCLFFQSSPSVPFSSGLFIFVSLSFRPDFSSDSLLPDFSFCSLLQDFSFSLNPLSLLPDFFLHVSPFMSPLPDFRFFFRFLSFQISLSMFLFIDASSLVSPPRFLLPCLSFQIFLPISSSRCLPFLSPFRFRLPCLCLYVSPSMSLFLNFLLVGKILYFIIQIFHFVFVCSVIDAVYLVQWDPRQNT